jgi:leucyl-tRNA synthetase
LAGYGTGAIMAVPSGDDRDHAFAKHFEIPITNIFGSNYNGEAAYTDKTGTLENSGFLSGIDLSKAIDVAIRAIVDAGIGKAKVNFKMRDAGFSRQRYWGEPFPVVYVNGIPYATDEIENGGNLPVELPMVENYKPGPEGEGPLANVTEWVTTDKGTRETNTMPGYAGSSWYFLRYMDPKNDVEFASKSATDYWREVDLYIGGTEHAVGHLLYSRLWTKVLHDLGHISFEEPFKKLVNQGMIQGSSRFVHKQLVGGIFSTDFDRSKYPDIYVSADLFLKAKGGDVEAREKINAFYKEHNAAPSSSSVSNDYGLTEVHVDVNIVNGHELDIEAFKKWRPENINAKFLTNDDGKFICTDAVEKMSKSKYNVVNPDDIVGDFGADTFRMYEMFLGPIDVSKPWEQKGIEGVHRFIKKMWRLYADEQTGWIVTDEAATDAELKLLHKTIKKIGDDIERFSFNTAVSQFMICVNELTSLNCHKRTILEPLAVLITPFAPHLAEELWQHCFGNTTTVLDAAFPAYEEKYTVDNSKVYPVAVNGKTRAEMEFALDMEQAALEAAVLADETIQKWMEGKPVKKFIYVKGKMINVVV